ncbi:Oidioi.mRNA.OKI2018_I69.PAR.g9915.t1.cds [Oikopleura dioica]|uniref:Oidioi.mRNA.OKI2018_I69.PAR.g9915.t1.cds n=1 Tax=Oikopleura dioica TaxID=34765 RepID=A0ABN7RRH9_OIKDI|nr:Oidioi.mRNA.OKI2018_I69.PAR.g9915.t1.cds [Oikopleura dioica]
MGSSSSKNTADPLNSTLPELESEQAFAKNKRQLEPDVIGAKLAAKAQVVAMFGQDAIYKDQQEKDQPPVYRHHPSPVKITPAKPDGKFYFVSVGSRRVQLPMYGKDLEFSEKVFKKENGIEDNEEEEDQKEEEPLPIEESKATKTEEIQTLQIEKENSKVSFNLENEMISPRDPEEMDFPIVPENEPEMPEISKENSKISDSLEESHPIPILVA